MQENGNPPRIELSQVFVSILILMDEFASLNHKLYLLYAQTNSDETILWTQEKFLGSSTFLFSTLSSGGLLGPSGIVAEDVFSNMSGSTQQMSSLELNFFVYIFFIG